jgi:predicted RNase H-like HicB family nuclease
MRVRGREAYTLTARAIAICGVRQYDGSMITLFLSKNLDRARYKLLDDGTYFGEVAGMRGVWANAKTLEQCRCELQEVLEDWLLLKVQQQEKVPGFSMRVGQRIAMNHASEPIT